MTMNAPGRWLRALRAMPLEVPSQQGWSAALQGEPLVQSFLETIQFRRAMHREMGF